MNAFWFHYNKPQTQREGSPRITVHYKNTCHVVANVICMVPVRGRTRKTQPRWVMAGKANRISFVDGIAKIE